jgi:hypothetical protein
MVWDVLLIVGVVVVVGIGIYGIIQESRKGP